ncbi:MAG: signal recognition particle protein [Anaerolineae bacterium]|nr:signal recognition particle protein [Anaerolineae bacterium]
MFENLTAKLQETFDRLGKRGKLTDKDVDVAMREVRLALLEADVNYKVVKNFVTRVKDRAIGSQVMHSLTPAQQVIKIVHEELIATLGESASLDLSGPSPNVIMLVGLQGSGKTTMAAKLALRLRKSGQRPLMVAADTYRPAAVTQLETLGRQIDVTVHSEGTQTPPPQICVNALQRAREGAYSVVLLDTAGRLQIDEQMMNEVQEIKQRIKPIEVLLIADAMTGQEAVNVADTFNKRVGLTGVIFTKIDGDARGGAAISIREVTDVPIKFLGTGEKVSDIEPFHPDRLASRILGMGDMLTLIEKAQSELDQEQAVETAQKMIEGTFNLEDFMSQLQQVKRLGPIGKLLEMIPGLSQYSGEISQQMTDDQFKLVESIIQSMTREERHNPKVLNASRKRRIARGSGHTVQEVNQLLGQFRQMQRMMKQLTGGDKHTRRNLFSMFQ